MRQYRFVVQFSFFEGPWSSHLPWRVSARNTKDCLLERHFSQRDLGQSLILVVVSDEALLLRVHGNWFSSYLEGLEIYVEREKLYLVRGISVFQHPRRWH
ncbi:hypothetical protein AVEN_186890-1 [Araneus ventricosus]|uniref:Uncharacterized protein n=1 Tax=Araneus ventricosus TaxID=182803 RepID=A0A4Y2I3A1_ARAVE|nr:hypothetical protein AVEN_186890-1 [Araneus ventricosus]